MAFSLAEEAARNEAARREDRDHVAGFAMTAEAIPIETPLHKAIEVFRRYPQARFLAVTDAANRPVGALHEQVVRDLLFSPFGHALLANPGCRWTLAEMVRPCPSAEIDASLETLLGAHGGDESAEGMILTRHGRYTSLLPSRALIRLAARREMREAEAAIARSNALKRAFDRFQSDAAEFVAALGAAAVQIRDSATDVADRAEHNGAQATAVAAASAQGADGIAEVASSSGELARQGAMIERRVADAEAAVRAAVGHVASSAEKAARLGAAADAIGGIVGLIAEISGKVNMLAINATIEAARAGEAGRSFAVVAGEVKSLANQAGEAARGIEAQIEAVRAAVVDSGKVNGAIAEIVARIEGATGQIRESVLEQSHATTMIAATVEQCAVASAQVSSHIGEIGGRARSAGEMAIRLGDVAEGLSRRADALRGRVDNFLSEIRAA